MLKLLKSLTTPTPGTYACQLVSTTVKPTSNGGQQLVIEVDDGGGAIKLSFFEKHPWFPTGSTIPKGECLSITGTFHADQWGVQCPDLKSGYLNEHETAKLFAGPEKLAAKQLHDWQVIRELIEVMPKENSYRALLLLFIKDHEASFRRAAAARGNHHARRGGLVEHVSFMMRNVASICNHYTELYPQMDRNLALCATFLHDVGKLWENNYPATGFVQEYDLAAEAIGHIVIGIQVAATYWNRLPEPMRSEVHKLRALQHCIASHHGTKEWGSPVEPACPEALILHFVDNIDAKLNMMVDCIATSERPAPFLVKKVFPMERNVILFGTMPQVSSESAQ